ncbi:MAG TPA: dihydrolipoamide acetyltransferase family protein [Terriglobia bacterium]|nr:dihydrolipoamide acetyltransferase family protein [Terriglobia bacterium]
MPTNVMMPQMGESVAEGTIVKWLKKTGERVERDEPLFEITTDKVDAEIPSPATGILSKILATENETVAVNTVVAIIDREGSAVAPAKPDLAEAPAREAEETPHAKPGSTWSGAPLPARTSPELPLRSGEKIRSSPLVRRIARERNVDLNRIQGTGLGGRINKQDILNFLARKTSPGGETPAATASAREAAASGAAALSSVRGPAPEQIEFSGPTHVAPMTPIRRQIAEHMMASKKTSAHVTTVFEAEMTSVVELRARMAQEFERSEGLKLTYTPFFVRAAVEAIKRFPVFNSSVEGANIVYKRAINVGIAVALETGLVVPVIKRADEKNFLGIARAVQDLAERARSKRLNVEDVQEGTFTVTNPGIFGSLFGTPIIHQPQVAILGVGAIEKRPVVRNDAIAIRAMTYLALTFDHRIIDGAVADQFMAYLKVRLENWQEPVL